MKTFIRRVWGSDKNSFGVDEVQCENMRTYLNEIGFYVLTGPKNSLDVYSITDDVPTDVGYLRKVLDIAKQSWQNKIRGVL